MPSPELLWKPSSERIERTTLTRYQRWLEGNRGLRFETYEELWEWSVAELEEFWQSITEFFDVRFSETPQAVLGRREMPGAEWFPGARVNYAEHVFRDKDPAALALQHASELRVEGGEWSWSQLRDHTARIAAGLRDLGVGEGDRVAAYLPNVPETVAAFLACASLGAVWSSAAPEFGARSVIDRFGQIEPKVLLAIDGYRYGGRDFDRREVVQEVAAELPGSPRVVTLGYLDGTGWEPGFLGSGSLEFAPVAFDHPLWVLYSSGTTGLPKPIVHGHGGILLEQLKKSHLHLDAQPGDRLFWFSTTGWMMWNFLVGVLLTDASIVLFDGNPGHPDLGTLWGLAERTRMTCFGTSAAFINGCMKAGVEPASRPRPGGAACGRLDRVAALPRGLPMGLRPARARHLAVLDLWRDGCLHRVRGWRADVAGLSRGASRARAGVRGRGVVFRRAAARGRGRGARDHRADALDAPVPVGR